MEYRSAKSERMSYDQKQAAAVLTTCSICKVEVYATSPTEKYVCICCQRDQERGK